MAEPREPVPPVIIIVLDGVIVASQRSFGWKSSLVEANG
jgi:hypothetical protein